VQIAEKPGQAGLTFFGRGYNVQVKAPLEAALATAMDNPTAQACAEACPTGAMVARNQRRVEALFASTRSQTTRQRR
jgi:NADH dehydrogenase/NADH:ubiquinone oxidoreductase subunit G